MTIELAAIVALKILGGLAIIVLSAVVIMALLLRFLNTYPVDRDEDRDQSDRDADQIIAASEPAPLEPRHIRAHKTWGAVE